MRKFTYQPSKMRPLARGPSQRNLLSSPTVPAPASRRPERQNLHRCRSHLVIANMGFDTFLPALGVDPSTAVFASALLATSSVVINFFSGQAVENKRAELAIELERDKVFQEQLRELQGVIARYRGPLLEAAIDLEQRLWHLVTDHCLEQRREEDMVEEVRYLMFTMAQFLGFMEVVRREGPRERPFLQTGNPQGSDTLSTLLEGVRFFMCASPAYLDDWYRWGSARPHPGSRKRKSREEVIRHHIESGGLESCDAEDLFNSQPALMRVPRGHQRAIGTLMISTPMGAERHYTRSYGDFHSLLESDPSFAFWFKEMEADAMELASGALWRGEGPFPVGRWTRVLLLQQILVELQDLLDPDCVRLPLDRRERLAPVRWGKLPRVSAYQKRLQALSRASDFGKHKAALEGLRHLTKSGPSWDEPEEMSLLASRSIDETEPYVPQITAVRSPQERAAALIAREKTNRAAR